MNAGQVSLESSRPGSSKPGSTLSGQISTGSRIKPTFSMLGNVFNTKSLVNKSWREGK